MPQTSMTNHSSPKVPTRTLVLIGLFTAIGIILSSFEFSIFPLAPYLKYDPGDIPILMGAMQFGPLAGLIMAVVISLVQSFLIHGSGGVYGFIMHVIASGTMALVVGFLYRKETDRMKNKVLTFTIASLAMVLVMVGANILITPHFLGVPRGEVMGALATATIPFNVLKALINSVATVVVHYHLARTGIFAKER